VQQRAASRAPSRPRGQAAPNSGRPPARGAGAPAPPPQRRPPAEQRPQLFQGGGGDPPASPQQEERALTARIMAAPDWRVLGTLLAEQRQRMNPIHCAAFVHRVSRMCRGGISQVRARWRAGPGGLDRALGPLPLPSRTVTSRT
jgi:hypothetical protein